jgi:type IV pilus assembly protein PilN
MIRINLLPFRAARKKENIKRQLIIFVLTVLLCLSTCGYFLFALRGELGDLKDTEKARRSELATYKKTLQKIKTLEKRIKTVKAKLTVIKRLERGKTGPVYLLDEISMAVPKDKLWLNSLREKKGQLSLSGTAMDNETVALFMNNLEAAEHIGAVDLKDVKLRDLPSYKLKVSDFSLVCEIIDKEKENEKETNKKTETKAQAKAKK